MLTFAASRFTIARAVLRVTSGERSFSQQPIAFQSGPTLHSRSSQPSRFSVMSIATFLLDEREPKVEVVARVDEARAHRLARRLLVAHELPNRRDVLHEVDGPDLERVDAQFLGGLLEVLEAVRAVAVVRPLGAEDRHA